MKLLITAALITLTMPSLFDDGTAIPTDKKLTAIVYRIGVVEPVAALVAYPSEMVSIETPQEFGSWYAVGWIIGTIEPSEPSGTFTKAPPEGYSGPCGDCHRGM